jgi:hypothetical protein
LHNKNKRQKPRAEAAEIRIFTEDRWKRDNGSESEGLGNREEG